MKVLISLLGIVLLVSSCSPPRNALQRLQNSGELRVLIKNVPAVYYQGPFGPRGFEYELVQKFADYLGVELKLIIGQSIPQLLEKLDDNEAHMAAARIIVTPEREQSYLVSTPYQSATQQLIYRSGTKVRKKPNNLPTLDLEVVSLSSQEQLLKTLKKDHPQLEWESNPNASVEDMLTLINERILDFTIVNSHEFKINQHFYPELRVAYNLSENLPISFFFSKKNDDSIQNAANLFLYKMQQERQIKILNERYYGHLDKFDYVDKRIFQRHIQARLPEFRKWFEQAGETYQLDWILLAAISYQESHWNPHAVSPTGVKGLMMLTQATAKYLGVNNRIEPKESIFGGAQYFAELMQRLPHDLPIEEKMYFALAAYNIGLGHIRDAIKLAKKRGLETTQWSHVKQVLPLLHQEKWYQQTRHGFARGREALAYVKNIRSYYDILKWNIEKQKSQPTKIKAFEIKLPAI